jgi:hypothetical protein
MKRLVLVFLLLLLAGPAMAQISCPAGTQSRTSRLVNKKVWVEGNVLRWYYLSMDSAAGRCILPATRVDTLWLPAPSPTDSTPADTTPPPPPPPPPSGLYPNRPASYTRVISDMDMSAVVPQGNAERPVGATGWTLIYDGNPSNFSLVTDATSPQSPGTVWRLRMRAGTYGGGVEGVGSGSSFGNIGRPVPGNALYLSYWIKWSANWKWHSVSTKHLRFCNDNVIIPAIGRGGGSWLRAEALNPGIGYEPQVNVPLTTGVWHHIEVVIVGGASGTIKTWVDGQNRTNYTGVNVPCSGQIVSIDGYMGGGGMVIPADQWYDLDHVFVATP